VTVRGCAYGEHKGILPCNATVEKQNCGVSLVGGEDAWVMMMVGREI
jgi:hypothetical protein